MLESPSPLQSPSPRSVSVSETLSSVGDQQIPSDSSDDSDDDDTSSEGSQERDTPNSHEIENSYRMRKVIEPEVTTWMGKLHDRDEMEKKYGTHTYSRSDFEIMERESADSYVEKLLKFIPVLLKCDSVQEVDKNTLEFASNVCAGKSGHLNNLQAVLFVRNRTSV